MKLRPMTQAEYGPFREAFVRDWAVDLARGEELSLPDATAQATQRTDAELTEGPATKNHFLFLLLEGDQQVGTLWFSVEGDRAFLDDVAIAPAFRGQGHGEAAMALLEQEAKARGCAHVTLNVYRHNPAALALYEKVGYATTKQTMRKKL